MARKGLIARGRGRGKIVRYAYRPFDVRWLYWEPDTKLLDRNRSEYEPHIFAGNRWLTAAKALRKGAQDPQYAVLSALGSYHLIERASLIFPEFLDDAHGAGESPVPRANVSQSVESLLNRMGVPVSDLFSHVVAVLNAPAYRSQNAAAFGLDWPRVPLPTNASTWTKSARLGKELGIWLDPELPAPGVTSGSIRAGLSTMGVPQTKSGEALTSRDSTVSAGWGAKQVKPSGATIVMPGEGTIKLREFTEPEIEALRQEAARLDMPLEAVRSLLGERTVDVYLNNTTWWANVPEKVWSYSLGGYKVLKKWLSYREVSVLGRPMKNEEVLQFAENVRRIAAILLAGPALDANYLTVVGEALPWIDGKPGSPTSADPAVTVESAVDCPAY